MRKIFWEILARLGFWIPCNKYLPNNKKYWDWVLISHCDLTSLSTSKKILKHLVSKNLSVQVIMIIVVDATMSMMEKLKY